MIFEDPDELGYELHEPPEFEPVIARHDFARTGPSTIEFDADDFEDGWFEECGCKGGAVHVACGIYTLCPRCQGRCYVRHGHDLVEVEVGPA